MLVTLLGRSNVGKSSLFNALVSQTTALPTALKSIVSEKPGTTRDAKYSHLYLRGKRITLVDTGGIESLVSTSIHRNEPSRANKLLSHVESETLKALKKANMLLFVVDGQEGITPLDIKMACQIREWCKELSKALPVNLIVNKLDHEGSELYYEAVSGCISDCYSLELGEPFFVSTYNPSSIRRLREHICKQLNLGEGKAATSLEDLALMSDSFQEVYGSRSAVPGENIVENDEEVEIDKSLRVFSPVRNAFRPNDKWIRLLNNICDTVPFTSTTEGKYAIPYMLSPAERLAKLYISKDSGHLESEQAVEDQQDTEEAPLGHCSSSASKDPEARVPNRISPLRILVMGTVDGFHSRLAKLLSDHELHSTLELDDVGTSLSPNWHKFYGKWLRKVNDELLPQPVEVYSAAALNLGGSLGKLSSLQTSRLIRKSDLVILCSRLETGRSKNKVALTKKEVSWISRVIRLHKPLMVVVECAKTPARREIKLDLPSPSQEFDSIPIVPITMQPANCDDDEATCVPSQRKKLRRLKREIVSLVDRAEKMIDTSTLNQWLRVFIAKWPPPWHEGSKVNVKFAAQVRGSPPTFVMWSNVFGSFPQHYLTQLKHALSEEFGFQGVPLKFVLRTTAEPKATTHKAKLSWKRKIHAG